ncbi:MAG TPA: peptidoglycan bridge formation glycyltransferase FemA/FemB family protein, partial [bacterium]|nr:peptidoglycan bridge formation glycyltransferase FemA/FemB family protein [bacterium]
MNFREISDKNIWNTFLTESNYPSTFLQSWNWGEFQKKLGSRVWRTGISAGEKLIGIASIIEVKAKRGKMLHVRHGPVIDYSNETLLKEITDYLKELAKQNDAWYIRISSLIKENSQEEESLKALGYRDSQMHDVDAEVTWVLDLNQSEDEILKGMRKNTRNLIRRAKKDGVEIIKSKNIDDVENHFWPIFKDTIKRQKWVAYDLDYIKKEFETLIKDDQTQLFLAKYKGKYIAASLFTYFNKQVIYHHSGSLTEFRKVPASYLVQWESILEAKNRGMTKYNFWGIAPMNKNGELNKKHPWSGLSFFKMGFGGRVEKWMHAKDLPVSKKYWLTNLFERIE